MPLSTEQRLIFNAGQVIEGVLQAVGVQSPEDLGQFASLPGLMKLMNKTDKIKSAITDERLNDLYAIYGYYKELKEQPNNVTTD